MKLSQEQEKSIIKFRSFVSFRNKIALILSMVIFIAYYAFILGVGLAPDVLGYRLGPSSITLGIMIGIFLIALCIIATGIYTFLANTYFDKDQAEILQQLEQNDLLAPLQNGDISYKNIATQCDISIKKEQKP